VWDLTRGTAAQVLDGFIADAAVLCLAVHDQLIVAGCETGVVHFLSFSSAYSSTVRKSPRLERRS
jgi:hypothetical protein